MSSPEMRIRSGGAVLALDSNAVLGFKRLQHLCNLVNRLQKASDPLDIRLYVPALVHMEVLFDLRQELGSAYDAGRIVQGLVDKGLEIQPFNEHHAEHAAARLGADFATVTEWHAAKRKRCLECLGIRQEHTRISGSGKKCGATIDFALAAHAACEGWILVTDDAGPDFANLNLKMRLGQLEGLLQELLDRHNGQW